jgi:hypothetical protein
MPNDLCRDGCIAASGQFEAVREWLSCAGYIPKMLGKNHFNRRLHTKVIIEFLSRWC